MKDTALESDTKLAMVAAEIRSPSGKVLGRTNFPHPVRFNDDEPIDFEVENESYTEPGFVHVVNQHGGVVVVIERIIGPQEVYSHTAFGVSLPLVFESDGYGR